MGKKMRLNRWELSVLGLGLSLAACSGSVEPKDKDERVDADQDGVFSDEDCDDSDPSVRPGAADVWYDGTDSDCGGNDDFDADGDGAPEFHDGWRQPIMFVRWPVGYASIIQSQNAALQPDPFDPSRVSTTVNYPIGNLQRDYAVVPLICSAGADGEYGISTGTTAWSSVASLATIRVDTGTSAPGTASYPSASDNITNHDLTKR
jgi:hypothetical protein